MKTYERATQITPAECDTSKILLQTVRRFFIANDWLQPEVGGGKMWLESRSRGYRCKLWGYKSKKSMKFLQEKGQKLLPNKWILEVTLENRRDVDPNAYYGKGIHIFIDKR